MDCEKEILSKRGMVMLYFLRGKRQPVRLAEGQTRVSRIMPNSSVKELDVL
jgi:hypothetical protein